MSFEENIRKVVPYVPGDQPRHKTIKLNTNECPYPPSPKVIEALKNTDYEELRRYPDPVCRDLVHTIAEYYGLKDEQVFVGVGSDDVISMSFLTFFAGKKPVLFPEITYSFYDIWANVYGIPFEKVPLAADNGLDVEGFKRENGGIVFANPNAPTGVLEGLDVVEEILKANPDSIVIVDEAYIDFDGETAIPLLDKYENLIITRTMSKSRALAGMRIGYAFGSTKLIKYLNDVKFSVNSYTMNLPSLVAGKAAMEDDEYFHKITAMTIETREWTKAELKKRGFVFNDSKTNFVFATKPGVSAKDLFEELKKRDIIVRYFNTPLLKDYLRISTGTKEEMEEFIKVLDVVLKEMQ